MDRVASNKVLSIDLGTANSAFTVMEGGDLEITVNTEGDRTTPSVVAFIDDGERLVDKPAENQAVQNPERTIRSIERRVGEDGYTVDIEDEGYTPEQISAMILQKIKRDTGDYLGDELQKAVVTVPTYFNDKQWQVTKDTDEITDPGVERIVSKPTTASTAYGLDDESDQTVLICDLGGSTFDVSILDLDDGVYEVVAANGDSDLGGDDWDEAIIGWLATELENDYGIDLREGRQALQRLKDAAEEVKIELSSHKETTINLPFIMATDPGPIHLEYDLIRAKLESLTADLIDRAVEPTEQALGDAGYDKDDINGVILIGDSARMPQVRDKVKELLGFESRKSVNSDEAVALGVAIQSDVLGGEVDDIVLLDVMPLSLSIEVKGSLFERLIEKSTTIPTEELKIFTAATDNQTAVQIRVFQGEREMVEDNKLFGEFTLFGILPAPAGTSQIEVGFNIDENGVVDVPAKNKGSGNAESITIEGGAGLSDEEIGRMQQEAERYAGEDRERHRAVEVRNGVEGAVQRAETLLEENEENVDDELRADIEVAVEDVEAVLEDDDTSTDELENVTEELSKEPQKISKCVYQQQAQAQAGGPGGTGAGTGATGGSDGADPEDFVDAGASFGKDDEDN